jgi:GTPase involved in cell partitioning and DNA repair
MHEDPATSYRMLRSEVMHHDPVLLERKSILALTQCDKLPGGVKGVDPKLLQLHERTVPMSAVSREGLDDLLQLVGRLLAGEARAANMGEVKG